MATLLTRTPFTTSRALEFFSERELTAQTGLQRYDWPLMVVKELADNALDACESARIAPELTVTLGDDVIELADNGPGLPRDVLERQLDFGTRTSTNSKYVSPTRGQQGNAIKAILAAPFVAGDGQGRVEVAAPGYSATISVRVDPLREEPVIDIRWEEGTVRTGTFWRVGWPGLSSVLDDDEMGHFLSSLAALNPHLTVTGDDDLQLAATQPAYSKWLPSFPTSAHWYDADDLTALIAAHLAADNDRPQRDLVREFAGLSSTAKSKVALEQAGLSGTRLSDLLQGASIDRKRVARLLRAMQETSQPIRPERLGVIGREHLSAAVEGFGGDPETFRYKRISAEEDGIPFVAEAAFAYQQYEEGRTLVTGVNWTPTYRNPFSELGAEGESLSGLLGDHYCFVDEPVVVVVHLATPKPRFTDRGKTSLSLPGAAGEAIITTVLHVVKDWERQRRREDRESQARLRRRQRLARKDAKPMVWLEAMIPVMPGAYAFTAGKTGIAEARQLMYAARPKLQEITGQQLDDKYFAYQLLPRFQREHPELTAGWNVVYDQRGHLVEPHTREKVPLSTLGVRRYLAGLSNAVPGLHVGIPMLATNVPTAGPVGRYQGIMFSEKEGMLPILERAGVPERFDVALMTTKGNTVTAARELVDELTAYLAALGLYLPIIVLHDFDVMGLTILATFLKSSVRYTYKSGLQIIDAGLRLSQALEMGLQDESVVFACNKKGGWKCPRAETLRENTASDEEIAFLTGDGRQGRRVELNAMSSDQFVALVETTLIAHGLGAKVIPDDATLVRSYREMVGVHQMNAAVRRIAAETSISSAEIRVPADLRERVIEALHREPRLPWDRALSELAEQNVQTVNGKNRPKSGRRAGRVI